MAYSKTNYVDGVTPLNAKNFNNNESGLDQVSKDVASISQALVQVDDKVDSKADTNHAHSELHSHSNKSVLDGVTSTKVNEWDNKSTFDGNYNSLTNKPTIPTVDVTKNYVDTELAKKSNTGHGHSEYTTESRVSNMIAEAQLGGGEVDLSGYATKDDLNAKSDVGHRHDASEIDNLPTGNGDVTKAYVDSQDAILDDKITVLSDKVQNHLDNHPSGDTTLPPNIANPNLVCWYEVGDKDNNSKDKKIWKDISGNGNDLELVGFDFNESNGWNDGHLVFDGVKTYAYNPNLLPLLSETNDLVIEIVGTCIESINAYNLVFSMFKDYDNYEGIRIRGGASIDYNTKTVKKSLNTGVNIGSEFNIKIIKVGSTVELYVNGNKLSTQTVEGIFQHNIPFTLGCGLNSRGIPALFSKCKIKSLKIEIPSWNTPTLTLPTELKQLSVKNQNILYFEKASKIDTLFIDGVQYNPVNKVMYIPKSISVDKNIFVEVKYKNDNKFLTHSIKTLPSDFYNLEITGKSPYDGEYYLTRFGARNDVKDYVLSVSNKGDITFYKEIKGGSMCFRKYEVKGKIRYTYLEMNGYPKPNFGAGFGFCDLVVLNENFTEIDRCSLKANGIVVEGYPFEQHDYIYLDDGHYIGLAYVGIDVSNIPNLSGNYKVVSAVIQEIKDGNVLMQFESTKFPSLYLDSTENNQYTDAPSTGTLYKDYAHINSVKIDPLDKNLIASFRNFDCVMKINRKNGEIIWTLGGKSDDFGLTDEQKFSKQHDATICSDGSILIFNNNNEKGSSSVKRFWLNEAEKTLVKCENHAHLDGLSINAMGGAIEVVPNKNVYGVSWGMKGEIDTLQEIDFDTNRKLLGIKFLNDVNGYIYKAFRTFTPIKDEILASEVSLIKARLNDIEGLGNVNSGNVTIPPINIQVDGVTLNKSTTTVPKGSAETLVATISPSNATNKNVTWSSSNTSIATVNNGVVTGVSNGSCVITATTVDGGFTDTCNVSVETITISVTGVSLDKTAHTFKVDETIQLTATVLPSNATNKNVTWTSSDETKATVVNGLVTAKEEGSATITVATEDGNKTATCNLTINAKEVAPPQNIITEGLLTWIDLANISGTPTIIEDKSGNGNYLTLHNVAEGFRSDGLLFDGVDDYGTFDFAYGTKDITVEVVFKKLETETVWGSMCSNGLGSLKSKGFNLNTSPTVIECVACGSGVMPYEKPIVDKLYCISLVRNGTKCFSYLNKSKKESSSVDVANYITLENTTYVGKNNNDKFKGIISAIRIYNRCLTDEEILQNHTSVLG